MQLENFLMTDLDFLQLALEEAIAAGQAGEVPVGAVLVYQGAVVASAQNRVLRDSDPTAHAEVLALRAGGRALGNYRLNGCSLFVTLEPCSMCAGALVHARVDRVVYATADPKAGAAGSVLSVINHPRLNHQMQLDSGLLAEESSELLKAFFRERR
uniref:tRNA-specific adenosine deaminase 2 n=1 Tax=mine drainage metagenome TaxID=410659 RepID=E6QN68_9ZZZZ